ncbi:MAG: hypothetical protein ACK476_18960 [Fluviicola sp.]
MWKLILFVIPVFLVACSEDPSKNISENRKEKPASKLTFKDWAKGLPAHLNCDTLYSNSIQSEIKECDKTFLPKNSQMIGWWMSEGSGEDFWFYLYLVYEENGEQIPYLEVFDSKGKKEFRKRLFNHAFLKKDSSHFGRVYRYKLDGFVTFESCKKVDGKIKVLEQEKYRIFDMLKNR